MAEGGRGIREREKETERERERSGLTEDQRMGERDPVGRADE